MLDEHHLQPGNEFNREQLQTVLPNRLFQQFQIIVSAKDRLEQWYWALLLMMLESIMRVCDDLGGTMDQENALPAASWNARNLLELWIWTEYCTASKENAWTFHGDALRDVAGNIKANADIFSSTGGDKSVGASSKEMHRSGASLALADRSCSRARRSWLSLRSCDPATSATLLARSPAALVARAGREPELALLSGWSLRSVDRPSPPRAAAPAPDAPESFLLVDNSACSPMP